MTGVQTCALPILPVIFRREEHIFQKIRFFAYELRLVAEAAVALQLGDGDGVAHEDAEMLALLRKHLVGQPQHLDIEFHAQHPADTVDAVKEVRQPPLDEHRHDLALRGIGSNMAASVTVASPIPLLSVQAKVTLLSFTVTVASNAGTRLPRVTKALL